MTDGIIKGTGNSRFLKGPANAAALYPDFESFRDAWAAGTLPVDFNGINPAGWEVLGDKLDKSTLLTDALCTALGLATTATPTQAMDKLRQLVNTAQTDANGKAKIASGSYIGTTGGKKTIITPFSPRFFVVSVQYLSKSSMYGDKYNISCGFVFSGADYGFYTNLNAQTSGENYLFDAKIDGNSVKFTMFDSPSNDNTIYNPYNYFAIG